MIVGGRFRTTENADGTTTIHDVPIFTVCKRGKYDYDINWMRSALQYARQAEADDHLPPLHVKHHGDGQKVIAAGAFRLKSIEMRPVKGKIKPVHICDMIVTNPVALDLIKSKQLLYRSVEANYAEGFIRSLALLDHEPPYHELAMTTVADEPLTGVTNGPYAFRRSCVDADSRLVFRSEGQALSTVETNMPEIEIKTPNGETRKLPWSSLAPLIAAQDSTFQAPPAKPETFEDDRDESGDDAEKMEEGEAATIDAAACVKAIEDGSISLADFEAIKAAMAAREGGEAEEEAEEAPMVEETEGPAEVMQKGGDAEMFSAMQVEQRKLRAEIDGMKAEKAMHAAVDAAVASLDGRAGMQNIRAELFQHAEAHGIDAMNAHAKKLADAIPPASESMFGDEISADQVPAEVQKFRGDPVKYEAAKAAAASYDPSTTSLTLEQVIDIEHNSGGLFVRKS